jgi:hypothetical protein
VADEANGTWNAAQAVPGAAALNADDLAVTSSVSCAAAEYCSAGGYYHDSSGASQAFIVDEMPVQPTVTTASLSAATVLFGHEQSERVSAAVSATLGTPSGTVTVTSGTSTICVITLTSGVGSCALTLRQLRPGTYQLVASFGGSPSFEPSASASMTLTVSG